ALEAEVRGLRDRTTALLAIAAPRNIQGMPAASRGAVGPNRRQLRRGSMVAAAAVVLGIGSWALTNDTRSAADGSRITTALVAPAIFARIGELTSNDSSNSPQFATANSRTLALAARATLSPRVIPSRVVHTPVAARKLQMVDPMLEIGPGGDGWETTSLTRAREAAAGAVPHL